MPTWPSGSKASTANVDAGTDSITSARADIKQNFDNVNTIIDTFNITTPSDGDLLQYSSSSGLWEQVASSTIGNQTSFAVFNMTATEELVAGTIYRKAINIQVDPSGLIDQDSTGQFTFNLASGTYMFMPMNILAADTVSNPNFYNETDAVSLLLGNFNEIASTGESLLQFVTPTVTLGATKTISLRMTASVSGDRFHNGSYLLIKLA